MNLCLRLARAAILPGHPLWLSSGKKGAGRFKLLAPIHHVICEARFLTVIPGGKPGIQKTQPFEITLDSAFRRNDGERGIQGDGAFTNDGLQVFCPVILEHWTGGIKGGTPLIPRFKGVSPL